MTYIFRFWDYLKNPIALTSILEKEDEKNKLIGYKKNLFILILSIIILFLLRDFYGMYTQRLTALLGQGKENLFVFARIVSLIGSIGIALLFFAFHYYIVTYFISLVTEIPFRWIQKVQLYSIAVITLFKLFEFVLFYIFKAVPIYSPFSLAAIADQFISHQWVLYFINQLDVAVVLGICIQYMFLRNWTEDSNITLLIKLIVIPILIAAVIATFSIAPIMEWLGRAVTLYV